MPGAPGYSGNTRSLAQTAARSLLCLTTLPNGKKSRRINRPRRNGRPGNRNSPAGQRSEGRADRVQKLRDDENKRVAELAKQNADRLAAQPRKCAWRTRGLNKTRSARRDRRLQCRATSSGQEQRAKEDAQRQAALEDKAKEGPIRDAGQRYSRPRQNYDIRDPTRRLPNPRWRNMPPSCATGRPRPADAQTADPIDARPGFRSELRSRLSRSDWRPHRRTVRDHNRSAQQPGSLTNASAPLIAYPSPGYAPAAPRTARRQGERKGD